MSRHRFHDVRQYHVRDTTAVAALETLAGIADFCVWSITEQGLL